MIAAQTDLKTGVIDISINGHFSDLMDEYKVITDYFLNNHFDAFMATMDRWNEEINKMTKTISITLDPELIAYVDEVAESNGRTRSNTIAWFIKMEMARDAALNEEGEQYE